MTDEERLAVANNKQYEDRLLAMMEEKSSRILNSQPPTTAVYYTDQITADDVEWLVRLVKRTRKELAAAQGMGDKPYYYLFAGEEYDSLGGVHDLKGYYISLEAAMSKLIIAESGKSAYLVDQPQTLCQWAHIATLNIEGALVIVAEWIYLDYPNGITNFEGRYTLEPTDNKHWQLRDSQKT